MNSIVYSNQCAAHRWRSHAATAGDRAPCKPARISRALHTLAVAAEVPAATAEDKFIAKNLVQFKDAPSAGSLSALKSAAWGALSTLRMPTTRNEDYRFTDISPLVKSHIKVANGSASVSSETVAAHTFPAAASSYVTIVNGTVRRDLSKVEGLPQGVYVGSVQSAPAEVVAKLGSQSNARGGPFAVINGAIASDALIISIPANTTLTAPLYILHLATGEESTSDRQANAPRMLVHAGKGAVAEVVEEFVAAGSAGGYFTCSVAELFLEDGANVKHGYVEREAPGACHFRATLVQQAQHSGYSLTETRLGGGLSRHDVGIQQTGPETNTTMRHFLLAGSEQLHDLHTRLELNHPSGTANQLHKCIVSHSTGRGVFDGNVKVNRFAQKTDAGQLSRNLLLVPRATVNVKPNLQIIADDVKCTHGCAISDLSDEEMFYFRARGINASAARQALVNSFGAEVTQGLGHPQLVSRIQADVQRTLAQVDLWASTEAADNEN